ncbi:ester cyclase [Methylobacterium oryzae CBMB20]
MSRESSIQATEKFGELVNGGRFDAFPEVVAPDCHDHDPAPGQHMGPEGYQAFFTQLRSAFPDMQVEVKKLVADGDSVAFAYTLTGTHQGDFNGHKPTGKAIKVRGMRDRPLRRRQDGRKVGLVRRARHPEADRRHRGLMEASATGSRPRDVLRT